MRSIALGLLGGLLFVSTTIHAGEACRPGHGLSDGELAQADLVALAASDPGGEQSLPEGKFTVRDIRYVRQNVFPAQTHWLARQANRFNTLTRESALVSALPFRVGDEIDEAQRLEAERVLRDKPYLYDTAVLVRRVCASEVDLDVVVRDVWTLTPGIGVARSGGDNETSVTLSDVNLLGTGKRLAIAYFDDRDRSGSSLVYTDPNIAGTRWRGDVVYSDNDDGERYGAALTRPFYALDTPSSLGIAVDHFVREQDLEFLGEDAFELDAESDSANLFYAFNPGRAGAWINRYFVGWRYLDETYEFPANFPPTPGVVDQTLKRTLSYPYVGWQLLEDKFVKRRDTNRIGVTEDVKLGWSSYVELGWSSDSFGGDGDYLVSRGSLGYRRYVGGDLFSVSARYNGRYELDERTGEDVRASVAASYLWQQAPRWRMLASARFRYAHNLSPETQLTLGGDSGLRGYPSRYQAGDRSFLVTLEERYYVPATYWGLFRIGFAAFVDVGRAWFEDDAPSWFPPTDGDHFDTLVDVGIGLRFESIRTRRDRVFHVDISKPLVDGPFVDGYEITLSGKRSL